MVSWKTQLNIAIKVEEHCSKSRGIWERTINGHFVSTIILYPDSSYRSDSSLPNTFRNSSPFSVNFFQAQNILDIVNCIKEIKKKKERKGKDRKEERNLTWKVKPTNQLPIQVNVCTLYARTFGIK